MVVVKIGVICVCIFVYNDERAWELGIHEDDLRAYIADNGTLSRVLTSELGMIQSGFDDAIVQINETSDKVASAITHR